MNDLPPGCLIYDTSTTTSVPSASKTVLFQISLSPLTVNTAWLFPPVELAPHGTHALNAACQQCEWGREQTTWQGAFSHSVSLLRNNVRCKSSSQERN